MMEGGGGCCIARYPGGGGGYEYVDVSRMHRIMLKFRPIAPKPGGSSSGGSSPDLSDVTSKPARGRKRRGNSSSSNKRAAKARNNNNNNDNNSSKGGRTRKVVKFSDHEEKVKEAAVEGNYVATLPLLPEAPDGWNKQVQLIASSSSSSSSPPPPPPPPPPRDFSLAAGEETTWWDSIGRRSCNTANKRVVVGSCVTVELVAKEAWMDVDGLGRTDEERRARLGFDTCPGFISDGSGKVTWTNDAYRKMVADDDDDENTADTNTNNNNNGNSMVVWLMTKWRTAVTAAAVGCQRAFSCRVRVQYYRSRKGEEMRSGSITVPCDVWGMEGGGFAWRLDLKAALSLGR